MPTSTHKPFSPLTLGNLTLENNIIQGPLAGYSCAPFRVLTHRYGKPAFTCTEMISANNLIYRQTPQIRYLGRDPEEQIVCYQLSGSNPDILARASERVSNAGADIIDLNCGCPVKKIRNKQAGSKLLRSPELIHKLVCAIKNNSDAPVSIKIRVADPKHDHQSEAVIDAAEKAGIDFIVVHGRHWSERYDVASRLTSIQNIAKLANVPVIANGDIHDYPSLCDIFEKTHCAGVMISRASVGNPWLFEQLRAKHEGQSFALPPLYDIGKVFIEHIERLMAFDTEKTAVLQARKLGKYYAKHLKDNQKTFTEKTQMLTNFIALKNLVAQYFK